MNFCVDDRGVEVELPHVVLVAPVGWYRKRLERSILKSQADKVYLVGESRPGLEQNITSHIAGQLREKFSAVDIDSDETANFHNFADVYKVFTKIVQLEKLLDNSSEILLDITSATKEGAIAASLTSQVFDVHISYVPPSDKKLRSKSKDVEEMLESMRDEVEDQGGGYLRYKVRPVSTDEDSLIAMKSIYRHQGETMGGIIERIQREVGTRGVSKEGSYKYWNRVLRALSEQELVEVRQEDGVRVSLSETGGPFMSGMIDAEDELRKRKPLTRSLPSEFSEVVSRARKTP